MQQEMLKARTASLQASFKFFVDFKNFALLISKQKSPHMNAFLVELHSMA